METFAGYRSVELVEEHSDTRFPMAVLYPTLVQEKTERLAPFSLDISIDTAPKKGVFPLVIISHGSGGSHLSHRTLAQYLARNGFVVGMPEHPFNNRNNNTLADTVELLANRPKHIQTAIDWFFGNNEFAELLKPDSISIIGHSIGAYTALAIAGGIPTSLPHQTADRIPKQISVTPDPRIKALVLLAPATV